MGAKPKKPDATLGGIYRNLTGGDATFLTRVWSVLLAIPRRLRRLDSCCGQYGEPGC